MYGLVNRAIEEMVRNNYGDDTWLDITSKAGMDEPHFVSLEAYPDDITYSLVRAASEVLCIPPDTILESFGEYWVLYTGRSAFGSLMNAAGTTLREFLSNLNSLHMRLGFTMPHLRPPSFRCIEISDTELKVNYHSEREGLAPMVIGLIKGLGKMLGEDIDVQLTASRSAVLDHDEFMVRFL